MFTSSLSTIWENTDGFAEQYRCTSSLYLMSVIYRCYSVTIDRGISAPGNGKEVVDGLNAVDKRYMQKLISNVQLPGSNIFDPQTQVYNSNQNNDVSLAKEFQQHLTKEHRKNGVIGQGRYKKTIHGNKMDRQRVSCSG